MTLSTTTLDTPVGALVLIASRRGLRAVLWPGEAPARVKGIDDELVDDPEHEVLVAAVAQLREYFGGTRTGFDLPLDPVGTDFQKQAWRALTTIPYGETVSYAEQARRLGRPSAVRAVGAANGRNPISIIVPCHRVVGSNGHLTGFAGGLETKASLLDHERRTLPMCS